MRRFLREVLNWTLGRDPNRDVEIGPMDLDLSAPNVELKVPTLGESVDQAELTRWIEIQGAEIKKDQPICELETEKVTIEVPSPATGRLIQILVLPGENVKVGSILGRIVPEKS